jgi:hypothetical protein
MSPELPSRPTDIDGEPPRAQNTPICTATWPLDLDPKPRVTAAMCANVVIRSPAESAELEDLRAPVHHGSRIVLRAESAIRSPGPLSRRHASLHPLAAVITIRHSKRARPCKRSYDADAEHARYLERHPGPNHRPPSPNRMTATLSHQDQLTRQSPTLKSAPGSASPSAASARSAADASTGYAVTQPSPRSSTPLTPPDGQQEIPKPIQGPDRPGSSEHDDQVGARLPKTGQGP